MLIVGPRVRCPRCDSLQEIDQYAQLERIAAHMDDLNVVLKCRVCRHVFSPKIGSKGALYDDRGRDASR